MLNTLFTLQELCYFLIKKVCVFVIFFFFFFFQRNSMHCGSEISAGYTAECGNHFDFCKDEY